MQLPAEVEANLLTDFKQTKNDDFQKVNGLYAELTDFVNDIDDQFNTDTTAEKTKESNIDEQKKIQRHQSSQILANAESETQARLKAQLLAE